VVTALAVGPRLAVALLMPTQHWAAEGAEPWPRHVAAVFVAYFLHPSRPRLPLPWQVAALCLTCFLYPTRPVGLLLSVCCVAWVHFCPLSLLFNTSLYSSLSPCKYICILIPGRCWGSGWPTRTLKLGAVPSVPPWEHCRGRGKRNYRQFGIAPCMRRN